MKWMTSLGEDETEFGPFLWFLPIGMLVFIGYFMLTNEPKSPPAPSSFTGCFSAPGAEPILFNGKKIIFNQADMSPTGYRLAFEKHGTIQVVTDDAIMLAEQSDARLRFKIHDRGWHHLIRLAREVEGRGYGVRSPSDAEYVQMLAWAGSDTKLIALRRVPKEQCIAG